MHKHEGVKLDQQLDTSTFITCTDLKLYIILITSTAGVNFLSLTKNLYLPKGIFHSRYFIHLQLTRYRVLEPFGRSNSFSCGDVLPAINDILYRIRCQ